MGWKSVVENGLGVVAVFMPFGPTVSEAIGYQALLDAAESQALDCAARGWGAAHCKAGWIYVGGIAASTIAAPPGVGNGVSAFAGYLWMLT